MMKRVWFTLVALSVAVACGGDDEGYTPVELNPGAPKAGVAES